MCWYDRGLNCLSNLGIQQQQVVSHPHVHKYITAGHYQNLHSPNVQCRDHCVMVGKSQVCAKKKKKIYYDPVLLREQKKDKLGCSVDRSMSPVRISRHARDKLNTPLQSSPQETIQSLLLSNQFPCRVYPKTT